MNVGQLKRVRWAVRATLGLGILASTAANVLHAEPNAISRVIAGWPPVALFIALELISKVPGGRRHRSVVKLAATGVIAGIAAWVSYWHMAAVAARYGETGSSPYLLPLSVDGLIVVATICLVELADRIRAATTEPATTPVVAAVPTGQQAAMPEDRPAAVAASEPATTERPPATPRPASKRPRQPATTAADRPRGKQATAAAIAAVRAAEPAITQQDAATRLAIGSRTVRRYWPETAPPAAANGRVPQLESA